MPDVSIQTFLPNAREHLHQAQSIKVPNWRSNVDFSLELLAQGKYNMNYLVKQDQTFWVLRVNTGSQINLSSTNQVTYEFKTLKLLEPAGFTSVPYFLDNSLKMLPYGILRMAYIKGEHPNYRRDLGEGPFRVWRRIGTTRF